MTFFYNMILQSFELLNYYYHNLTFVYVAIFSTRLRCLQFYQIYFIDFINPFPGHNTPQTFIGHTSDVTTVHNDINKIKTMFFGVKLTTLHRLAQNWPTIIKTFLVYPPSIIFYCSDPITHVLLIKFPPMTPI